MFKGFLRQEKTFKLLANVWRRCGEPLRPCKNPGKERHICSLCQHLQTFDPQRDTGFRQIQAQEIVKKYQFEVDFLYQEKQPRKLPSLRPSLSYRLRFTHIPHEGAGTRLASPEHFLGDPRLCQSFITDCQMHFDLSPLAFSIDRAKVAFMIPHLAGSSTAWAMAEWHEIS